MLNARSTVEVWCCPECYILRGGARYVQYATRGLTDVLLTEYIQGVCVRTQKREITTTRTVDTVDKSDLHTRVTALVETH